MEKYLVLRIQKWNHSIICREKRQLYEWLTREKRRVKLEWYLSRTRQRPDLLLPEVHLAIEYQCSSISNPLLKQRTEDYSASGLDVLWILGAKRLNSKHRPIHSISAMEWSAATLYNCKLRLHCYCPIDKRFASVTLLSSLTFFRKKSPSSSL
ncbi:competence protein CoiA family protein [Guptibacillus hwajinpoensis]|uniref:competence protein CoiA family protein n=1 Tax=Guptibacillus hwajinpoensis TaxID=208199 RepID=UPI003D6B1CAB